MEIVLAKTISQTKKMIADVLHINFQRLWFCCLNAGTVKL